MNEIINKRIGWTALAFASVVASSSALLAHAYVGSFGRLISDDYCTAGVLRSYGFFGAAKYWFLRWNGRYSFILAIDLAHLIGPKIVSFLPILVLSYWVAALTWAISQVITRSFGALRILASALLAEIIIFGTLATSASVFQSLYWQTGVLTYVLPLLFATTYAGLLTKITLANESPGLGLMVFGGCLTFIAAGFSESFAALQGLVLLLAFILSLHAGDDNLFGRNTRAFLFIGLVGAGLGAGLVLLAPGNNTRMAEAIAVGVTSPPSRTWIALVKTSILFCLDALKIACKPWRFVGTGAFVPAILAFTMPGKDERLGQINFRIKQVSKRFGLVSLIGLTMIMGSFIPTAYVTAYLQASYYPPGRLFIIPQFFFYCWVVLASYSAGMAARDLRLRLISSSSLVPRPGYLIWLFGIACLGSFVAAASSVRNTLAVEPTVRKFASAWDEQDQKIRAAKEAGLKSLRVEPLPSTSSNRSNPRYFGLRLNDTVSSNWVNQCVADYYGLDSIVAE
jgi:hypothetical protein